MMSPSSTQMFRIGGIVCLIGVVGAAAFLNWQKIMEAVSPPKGEHAGSIESGHTPETSHVPAGNVEIIEFPKDMWGPAGIKIQSAKQSPLIEMIELTGTITFNEDKLAHIFPLVEGRVDEVKTQFGQRVKKGDPLVAIQSKEVGTRMLQLFQDRLKLDFGVAKNEWNREIWKNTLSLIEMMRAGASIEQIETTFRDRPMGDYREKLMTAYVSYQRAATTMQRLSPLTREGAVAGRQFVEAEADRDATRAVMQSLLEQITQDIGQERRFSSQHIEELRTTAAVAEANLKILGFEAPELADINPARQGEDLGLYLITAPFDGTVISKDVVLLERVSPERQILTIADLSTVWVTADIYQTHLPILAQLRDQKIRVRSEAWPGEVFEAQVFYTGDIVQETTRTIAMRAVAPNDQGKLKPGMFVTIELPSLNMGKVLQIPATSIQDHEGNSFVFVQVDDDKFERRDVKVGRSNRNEVEILAGLKVDDPIVVQGGFALKSKMLASLLAE